ncbi:hypothetical protein [Pollutimonas bauzanensis]|uniref:Uncharacterized protein n=1 Tax=Pollutimonas bauzanensis TaxID=658167 RepID=A0A1M5ZBC2_9BURK|nr:hypothetical protein [Pollutimonas bauzanensis]SHI21527.1 hypothetical protein SAMN04488135_113126 [Pollutimonas bauzanensis]
MNIQSLHLVVDLNGDGRYSLWELWEAVKLVYRLPGNLMVEGLGHIPYLSTALHIQATPATGYASFDGLIAVTLALIFWVVVVFSALTLCSPSAYEPDDAPGGAADASRNPQYHETAPAADDAAPARTHRGAASAQARMHLPVSRSVYTVPGKKPKRRHWHHLVNSLMGHAK